MGGTTDARRGGGRAGVALRARGYLPEMGTDCRGSTFSVEMKARRKVFFVDK